MGGLIWQVWGMTPLARASRSEGSFSSGSLPDPPLMFSGGGGGDKWVRCSWWGEAALVLTTAAGAVSVRQPESNPPTRVSWTWKGRAASAGGYLRGAPRQLDMEGASRVSWMLLTALPFDCLCGFASQMWQACLPRLPNAAGMPDAPP